MLNPAQPQAVYFLAQIPLRSRAAVATCGVLTDRSLYAVSAPRRQMSWYVE
jgi:hypothetical protein